LLLLVGTLLSLTGVKGSTGAASSTSELGAARLRGFTAGLLEYAFVRNG